MSRHPSDYTLVAGGQGRDERDVTTSAWLAVCVVALCIIAFALGGMLS